MGTVSYTLLSGELPITVELIGSGLDANIHTILESGEFINVPIGNYELRFTDNANCIESEYIYGISTTTTTTLEEEFIFDDSGYSGIVYYVSESGDDGNNGTSVLTPFQTITKVNTLSLSAGDAVLFKASDEFRGTVTIPSSGTSGNPITIGAYGTGTRPKIKGSEVVTGWTLHSGNIYKATVANTVTQVFLDDTRIRTARTPNTGYYFTDGTNSDTISVISSELNSEFDYTGARINIRTSAYNLSNHGIASSSGTTLTLDSVADNTIVTGRGFFLTNKLEFLDQAGEWYYDTSTTTLYLWTPNGDSPANYTIEASTISNGIYASSKNYITVKDLDIRYQKDNGIQIENRCDYITIDNNKVLYQEGYGIRGSYYSSSNQSINATITNNYVEGQNGRGINYIASNSLVEDNTVKNVALFENLGLYGTFVRNHGEGLFFIGVWSGSAGGSNIIRYNTIENVGYAGIYFSGHNTTVQYNYIDKAVQLKGDNGGIYASWKNRSEESGLHGTVISYNIVRRSEGTAYGYVTGSNRRFGEGIYIDEQGMDVVVEYNTIEDVSDGGIFTHDTENVTVRYNTVFGGRSGFLLGGSSGTLTNNYHDNIVAVFDGVDEDSYYVNELLAYKASGSYTLYNNKYYNAYHSTFDTAFKYTSGVQTFAQWVANSGTGESGSTYTPITLAAGETQRLLYNNTKVSKTFNLNGATNVRDLDGTSITGDIIIASFESKIVIGTNLDLIS